MTKITLHTVSCTQQGRQEEPRTKTLPTSLSAEFWRHYVLSELSGGTQRRPLPRYLSEEIKIYILDKYYIRMGIQSTTSRVYSHTLCHDWQ